MNLFLLETFANEFSNHQFNIKKIGQTGHEVT